MGFSIKICTIQKHSVIILNRDESRSELIIAILQVPDRV